SLTLSATDFDGNPTAAYVVLMGRHQDRPQQIEVNGTKTLRLPAGTYAAMSFMDVHTAPDELGAAMVGDPQIELTGDTVLELDARKTEPITVDVPEDGVVPTARRMEYSISAGTPLIGSYMVPDTVDHLYAAPMDGTTDGDFEYVTRWRLRTPFITLTEDGTALDAIGMPGSVLPTEEFTLEAVYAGTGTADDLAAADVDGKAVVITRDQSQDLMVIAAGVEAAGAAALVIVNDE